MIPATAPWSVMPLSVLPAGQNYSTPNPLAELVRNPLLERVYLLIAKPLDPLCRVIRPVYLSSDRYHSLGMDAPAFQLFRAVLKAPYSITTDLMSLGRFAEQSSPAAGVIDINNPPGTAPDGTPTFGDFDYLKRFVWAGQEFEILLGRPDTALSQFAPIFKGSFANDPGGGYGSLQLRIEDPSAKLHKYVQEILYKGYGYCIRLNGSTDHVDSAAAAAATSDVTFEMRFRCRGNNAAVTSQLLAWQGTALAAAAHDWSLKIDTAGHLIGTTYRYSGGFTNFTYTAVDLRDSAWHHVAITITPGVNGAKLYLDGALVGTWTPPALTAGSGKLWIGSVLGTSNFALADVDEVRYWNVVRAAADLNVNRDLKLAGTETGLRLLWQFEEDTGTVVQDTTAANLDGTASSATLWIGTGEGGDELRGTPKPVLLGRRRQINPVPIDDKAYVYQIHFRSMQGVLAAFERGVSTITYDGDVADVWAWTPVPGHFVTCNALGLIRCGAKPDLLTVAAEGDNVGGYVSTAADIVRRLGEIAGLVWPTAFDVSGFQSVNLVASAVIGLYARDQQVYVDDMMAQAIRSVGGWWGHTRLAELTVRRVDAPGVPTITLGVRDVKVAAVEPVELAAPPYAVRVAYRPYDTTQDVSSFPAASPLNDSQKLDLSQQFRYVTATDTEVLGYSVRATYTYAEVLEIETSLDDPDAARAEAERQLRLLQKRVAYKVPLTNGLFQYDRGSNVALKIPRWDLDRGRRFVVSGFGETAATNEIYLTVWGGDPDFDDTYLARNPTGAGLVMNARGNRLLMRETG